MPKKNLACHYTAGLSIKFPSGGVSLCYTVGGTMAQGPQWHKWPKVQIEGYWLSSFFNYMDRAEGE